MRKSLALIASLSLMGCSVVSAPVVAEESSTNHKRMLPVDTEVVTEHWFSIGLDAHCLHRPKSIKFE